MVLSAGSMKKGDILEDFQKDIGFLWLPSFP